MLVYTKHPSSNRVLERLWLLDAVIVYLAINRMSIVAFGAVFLVYFLVLRQDKNTASSEKSSGQTGPQYGRIVPKGGSSVESILQNRATSNSGHAQHADLSDVSRSDLVWVEDGNFVIIVQSTAFRFYGGLLSMHSAIFKDMFSIPQPSNDTETFDGCPYIRLNDSVQDFAHFLQVILGLTYVICFLPGQNSN